MTLTLYCLGVILQHTLTIGIHDAEAVLCVGITLFRSRSIPLYCLGVILRHTLTCGILDAEAILRAGIALFSRQARPLDRFRVSEF